MAISGDYLKKLRERAKKSRIRTKYQFIGLKISRDLDDKKHKALYIKLAKEGNPAKLQWLAAEVASRERVKKKGAYFMKILLEKEKDAKRWLARNKSARRAAKKPKAQQKKQGRLFPASSG